MKEIIKHYHLLLFYGTGGKRGGGSRDGKPEELVTGALPAF